MTPDQYNRLPCVRRLKRLLTWPRDKVHAIEDRYFRFLAFRLGKYGAGEQLPYADVRARKNLQIAIDNENRRKNE